MSFFKVRWNLHNKIKHFKVTNFMVFNTFTKWCKHYLYLVPNHCPHSQRKPCAHWVVPDSHSPVPGISGSVGFPPLCVSNTWNDTTCDLLCPAAFASVVFTHVVKELSCLISVLFLSYHRLICLQNSFL